MRAGKNAGLWCVFSAGGAIFCAVNALSSQDAEAYWIGAIIWGGFAVALFFALANDGREIREALQEGQDATEDVVETCPQCKTTRPTGWKFCSQCGCKKE